MDDENEVEIIEHLMMSSKRDQPAALAGSYASVLRGTESNLMTGMHTHKHDFF